MRANPIKHAMKYGLYLGGVFSLNFLLSTSQSVVMQLLTYLVIAAILYLTYRFAVHYRENEMKGCLTYWQGFSYVLWLFLFSAIVSSAVKFFYCQFLVTEYLENMMNQTMLMLETMQFPIGDAEIAQIEAMLKPARFSLMYLWVNAFVGMFVGLVMAAFTKKEKSIFEDDTIAPMEK